MFQKPYLMVIMIYLLFSVHYMYIMFYNLYFLCWAKVTKKWLAHMATEDWNIQTHTRISLAYMSAFFYSFSSAMFHVPIEYSVIWKLT